MISAGIDRLNDVNAIDSQYAFIIERRSEPLVSVSQNKNEYVFEGIAAKFGIINDNGRLYEKADYMPHLSYLNQKIGMNRLTGELDHPEKFETSLKNISHIVEKLWYNESDDTVRIRIRLLNTPHGEIAKTLVDAGIPLCISSRSAGQILQEGRVNKVKLHRIFTFDLVAEPGFADAILQPSLSEGLKQNYQMISENLNVIKSKAVINSLESLNENYDFANNIKIYKINKSEEAEFIKAMDFDTLQKNENNSNTMGDTNVITKDEFGQYTQKLQGMLSGITDEMRTLKEAVETAVASKKVNEAAPWDAQAQGQGQAQAGQGQGHEASQSQEFEAGQSQAQAQDKTQDASQGQGKPETTELDNITEDDDNQTVIDKLVAYVNFLSTQLENVMNHTSYVTEMLNKSIGYSENLGVNLNNLINHSNYLGKKVNEAINYAETVGKITNEGINYTEMIGGKLSDVINFADLLATRTNEAINYSDYGFRKLDEHIDFTDYLVGVVNTKQFSDGSTSGINDRNLTDNVTKITESKDPNVNITESYSNINDKINGVLARINENSNASVLEARHPFLKLMTESDKQIFFALEDGLKKEIVATLEGTIYFTRNDVVGIMNAIVENKNEKTPTHIKYMPIDYKPLYEAMTEEERFSIDRAATSGVYKLNTPYQVKTFWDSMQLSTVRDRMISENQNTQQLAENANAINENQSKEGYIPVSTVLQMQRGYSNDFLNSLMRK